MPPVLAQVQRADLCEEAEHVAKSLERFSTMLVVGIGGSSLGLRAVVSALGSKKNLVVCDSVDPDVMHAILKSVDWSKTAINIISKSGDTLEIMAIASLLIDALKTKVGQSWTEHVVVTTDPSSGFLRKWATENKLATCQIPTDVGGRFSIFTAVGILPMCWAGLDIREFWMSADNAVIDAIGTPAVESRPLMLAAQHVAADKAGRSIAVIMPYATGLGDYARWFVQLWAESLGKGGKGQTPMVAVGTADQHAQLQMFAEGPKNKMIRFVTVDNWRNDLSVPMPLDPAAGYLKGKTCGQMLTTAAAAMADALGQVGCPSYTLRLKRLDEAALGYLMMTDIMMTVAAATLYDVNPYGQPGVELGKKLWRERIEA